MFIFTLHDIIGVCAVAVIAIFFLVISVKTAWRQWRCKHTRVFETRACDAVCKDCGKNLGFIQTWRDAQKD